MSPITVTFKRTLGKAFNMPSTAYAIAVFLAVVGVVFSYLLKSFEGSHETIASIWTVCVAPIIPILVAFLGIDVWCRDHQSGIVESLLATAIEERDIVLGKYLGLLVLSLSTIALSLLVTDFMLGMFVSNSSLMISLWSMLPAFIGIAIQTSVWCSISAALSTMFGRGSISALATIACTVIIPRILWAGVMSWFQDCRLSFTGMPFDVHVKDMAVGLFSVNVIACYLTVAVIFLLVAVKVVSMWRLVGRGAQYLRRSVRFSILLYVALCASLCVLFERVNLTFKLSYEDVAVTGLNSRTLGEIEETGGGVSITCFLPRNDKKFDEASRLLRTIKNNAESMGLVGFSLRFVDPNWDVGPATRLIKRGVPINSVVFEKGHRLTWAKIENHIDEQACASAIGRLSIKVKHKTIYWTIGHKESRFNDYSALGMSDIARMFVGEGFENRELDLVAEPHIPSDCAFVVVAGAKDSFSRSELGRLEEYLRVGGRMLILANTMQDEGLRALLLSWGFRASTKMLSKTDTISGFDVMVSKFSNHQITASLNGSHVAMFKPMQILPSTAVQSGIGVDKLEFSPLAMVGDDSLAAVVERGTIAGSDLAIRPTRIVVIGDSCFALNGHLMAYAGANQDMMINCADFLSGSSVLHYRNGIYNVLNTGVSRKDRLYHLVATSVIVPLCVLIFLLILANRRRK